MGRQRFSWNRSTATRHTISIRSARPLSCVRTLVIHILKLMADLFHMNIEEADTPASIRTVEDYLGHCHLADSNRLLPGHGHTDFVSSFRALREIEFEGWLALECSVTGDPSKSLPACVEFLRRCWERAAPDETDN